MHPALPLEHSQEIRGRAGTGSAGPAAERPLGGQRAWGLDILG